MTKSSGLVLVFLWEKRHFSQWGFLGQCRAMWEPDWLTDRQRWCRGGRGWISTLTACHSFLGCHKSLPSPLKVRLHWLLADLQALPARHMSFYQPRPRWHCGGRVLTPLLMRRGKEGRGGKSWEGGRNVCAVCVRAVGEKRAMHRRKESLR